MKQEIENRGPRDEIIKGKLSDGCTIPVLILMVVSLVISCSIFYVTAPNSGSDKNSPIPEPELITAPLTKNATRKIRIKTQPNCTKEEYVFNTLHEIFSELRARSVLCAPGDVNNVQKHNVPIKKKSAEPRGHAVVYIAVGLLLISVVVAFLDVYKVKGKPSKSKPQLTKRCSLADLTVLRHSRRESMKKDSMMDDHRVPLKLLGARPPPENRRCSVPVYGGEIMYGNTSPRRGSRKCSLDNVYSNDYSHTRVRLVRRF